MAKQGIISLLLTVQYVQCLSITFTHYRQGSVDHGLSNSVVKYFRHATCKYRYRAS